MHLLTASAGEIDDGARAVDLDQDAADIVVLSAAGSDLACLSSAKAGMGEDFPTLRLASLLDLGHHLSVDLYVEKVVSQARLVVIRLLGGRSYWTYGVEQARAACLDAGIPLALLPGDDQPDSELVSLSTLPPEAVHRLWQYMVQGGVENSGQMLAYAATLIGRDIPWREPRPLPPAGIFGEDVRSAWTDGAPIAVVTFYRSGVLSGDTKAVTALVDGLRISGLNPLPIYVTSLRDPVAAAMLEEIMAANPPDVAINLTGFSVASPDGGGESPFVAHDCPVIQVAQAGSGRQSWEETTRGLSPRDIAMNVALPEVDGRIFSRAISFKDRARRDEATQCDIMGQKPEPDRIEFVCRLAANWAKLRRTPPEERRVALVLANYPNRDGRIGNGVGLDTPASVVEVLHSLRHAGYLVEDIPEDGDTLVKRLQEGPTNAGREGRVIRETLSLAAYRDELAGHPEIPRRRMIRRWGPPEKASAMTCSLEYAIPAFRSGNVAVVLQPARGYNVEPSASYHDPDLPPTHDYLATYAWIRNEFKAQAIVHMGKHGNLEWLPGKALALSSSCFPEMTLGPLPHLYPFIVNDPGEGTQAKRRAGAVIIDHLTPPLTRAESYGPLKDLESLVDEYYEAASSDPRRIGLLQEEILSLAHSTGIGADCGITPDADNDEALQRLDAYLCEIKEMQIRDGLHVFGRSPEGRLLTDLLTALVRAPRGRGEGGDASLQRAIAHDLGLSFDPLDCSMAEIWEGPRPEILAALSPDTWRTAGDTVERIEILAARLIEGEVTAAPAWKATTAVLEKLESRIRPAVRSCGEAEISGLLTGLDGRFVAPGPSGAPTRGRPEVLPTGRNFYSVDTRAVPTPAAWTLGWKSAALLLERHLMEHGEWPKSVAITAWGTSNMRTGGDDIAQGLALMGVRPTWDNASRRVTGFEIIPASVLDRPRIDVTLRVSGFFRDAFPSLIDLFDSAARAVAALDEGPDINFPAAQVRSERKRLVQAGLDEKHAELEAGYRVFGSMPGAYGAGLQALIDERGWNSDADLARAYVVWGGYAYGRGEEGRAAHGAFENRLKQVKVVIQNQDNREHDLLDSDDYYQFEGGMAAAVRNLSGAKPTVYHADHSRPESPRIRTLEEEISRVVRARVVNPKWIAGVMRHGYKGAFEMAATVDYMFAFAATARCVRSDQFDAVFRAYLEDGHVRDFLGEHNPAGLKEIAARLLEAQCRGLWTPRLNSTRGLLERLAGG